MTERIKVSTWSFMVVLKIKLGKWQVWMLTFRQNQVETHKFQPHGSSSRWKQTRIILLDTLPMA